jgi:hypothetical protein
MWIGGHAKFDVYVHGHVDGPDEAHWSHAEQVLSDHEQFIRRAIAFASEQRTTKPEWRLWQRIGMSAWEIQWFGFGAPGLPCSEKEFHIAVTHFEDDYGLWKVWFQFIASETWSEERITREDW